MKSSITVSQELELIPTKVQQSYVIGKDEWGFIKNKISLLSTISNIWNGLGAMFIGTAISTLITALIGDFSDPKGTWICWSAFGITFFGGFLCFIFGYLQKDIEKGKKDDIIDYMGTIENKYEN